MSINEGTFVVVANNAPVPARYAGRTGLLVGTVTKGRGIQYAISFEPRRATPLIVPRRFVTVA